MAAEKTDEPDEHGRLEDASLKVAYLLEEFISR